ncbi:MAG: sulfotransferase [Bacteroidales bacterium]|jgi:hypothetical protein|nr:sulfotransferase [Bacteroidales bacterium]MDD4215340.1 sulfotransferase [Bacteroidales bacterium]
MKNSYLLAGIETNSLLKLVKAYNISYKPKYIFRFLFLLQNALWASFFKKLEQNRYARQLEMAEKPENPVFIIGHWRTGSTFLHQLMSLDENIVTTSLFQTLHPDGFKCAYPYFRPLMKMFLGSTRPFDKMKINMDVPQEDEFALLRLTAFSPMLGMVFPEKETFFLKKIYGFLPDGEKNLENWKKQLLRFYTKVVWNKPGRLLIKNPYHSFRIQHLKEMFPAARFIHIYRNPLHVVPSTLNMWSVVGAQNNLNARWRNPDIADVAEVLGSLLDNVEKDLKQLPAETYTEIRYEDMIKNPIETLLEAYKHLGIELTPGFEQKVKKYVEENKNYSKSNFVLTAAEKEIIVQKLLRHMLRQQYLPDEKK